MRRVSAILVIAAVAATISGCSRLRSMPSHDPNLSILLITIDTLRADGLGSYGNARAATPWMDRLAAAGVRFDRAHAHTVVTLPSHASILSGAYPQDHGVRDNAGFRFPPSRSTIATVLKARGYSTGAFISAFPLDARFGLARGFDAYDAAFIDAAPRAPMLEQERRGVDTVALARRWLDAHADARTFCWVHLYEPHAPYAPPEPFASRFRDDPYAGEVAAADAALEPLLRPILEAGRDGHTLVVLTGDHGESLGDHGEATHGVFAYEATLRIPLIVYAPTLLSPRTVAAEARHVDVLPTILDALDVPAPDGIRGTSLLPLATGRGGDVHAITYFESLSPSLNRGWAPLHGVVRNGLKYIDLPLPELYDLDADPQEAHNLMASRAADANALRRVLASIGAADTGGARLAESAEVRARLESLGYASGGIQPRDRYTADDDPKRLIALDTRLQDIVRSYVAGDRRTALSGAQALVRERPGMRVAWMTLAQIQRDAGDLDDGIASLRRAQALAPGDPQTISLLGAYLTERGSAAEAVAILSPSASAKDADLQVLVALALAQARTGRSDEAAATLERARTLAPSNAMLLVDLGTIRLMGNHRAEARQAFEAALARNPALARAHSSLAAMAAEEGRPADASAHWQEAARIDPAEYRRMFQLGVSFARAGHAGPARVCFSAFVDSAPPAAFAHEIEASRAWLSSHR